jgi:uncharacterized membrane protein YcgQ (UPF0703/DUF1980 family)
MRPVWYDYNKPSSRSTLPATLGAYHNPGILVSLCAETNLKLTSYWLRRHQEQISRMVTEAEIQHVEVRSLHEELNEPEQHHYVKSLKVTLINDKDWTKTMEAIEEYLQTYLG